MVKYLIETGFGIFRIGKTALYLGSRGPHYYDGFITVPDNRAVFINFVREDTLYVNQPTHPLNPRICDIIIKRIWLHLVKYMSNRKTMWIALKVKYDNSLQGYACVQPEGLLNAFVLELRINLGRHFSYLDFVNSVVHELAHVLENFNNNEDHRAEFCSNLRAILCIVKTQPGLDLSFAGISHDDLVTIDGSVLVRDN